VATINGENPKNRSPSNSSFCSPRSVQRQASPHFKWFACGTVGTERVWVRSCAATSREGWHLLAATIMTAASLPRAAAARHRRAASSQNCRELRRIGSHCRRDALRPLGGNSDRVRGIKFSSSGRQQPLQRSTVPRRRPGVGDSPRHFGFIVRNRRAQANHFSDQ
jgi:hypothetical protein